MASAYIEYSTSKYDSLCFTHAARQAVKGRFVHTSITIVEDSSDDTGAFCWPRECKICKKLREQKDAKEQQNED